MRRTLNLGILAHVDAGKTSLTERLLYNAGVIGELGSVDTGTTQTDALALERERGITIRSAVASLLLDGVATNLVDTPGHPDFVAEVERVLGVLDGAVLVLSAVEGVQPQTRILMRALQRLQVPTILFVNKIDRRGARHDDLLREIRALLSPDAIDLVAVEGLGTRAARVTPHPPHRPAFRARLVDLLSRANDELLADFVRDESVASPARLDAELIGATSRGQAYPVYFGSAITGAGIDTLSAGITRILMPPVRDASGTLSATVFKIERGASGEPVAYVRVFDGTLRIRDRVSVRAARPRVTAIEVFGPDGPIEAPAVSAGQLARLRGLAGVRIGDDLGTVARGRSDLWHFARPTLETVVRPIDTAQRAALHHSLGRLAEQDPLIAVRQDDRRAEISVTLYGEVQKEVIEATLAREYGVRVTFARTTPICIERPLGTGAAAELIGIEPNPFLATVGLRIEPAPVGSGVRYGLEVELGSMPAAFLRAVEDTVHATLREGLAGWQVTDCDVTLTDSGYWARQSHAHATFDKSMSSTAGDFRSLTPLVLMAALRRAGTVIHEPVHRFRLEIPAESYSAVLPALSRLRAVPEPPVARGDDYLLEGAIPAGHVHDLQLRLPALTSGAGVLESAFDHYRPAPGPATGAYGR